MSEWFKSSHSHVSGTCVEVMFKDSDWVKSSRSSVAGHCVEVNFGKDGDVAVRDSKNPDQAPLIYTQAEWDAFVAGVKDGEFNYPIGD
jgi:hypothetical protein